MANDSVNSILRIMMILESFTQSNGEWNLTALSQRLSLPPSTTHRLLNTLVQLGYIKQEKQEKAYCIGDKLVWFCCSIASRYDLRSLSWTHLQALAKTVQETIHLCKLDGSYMFYVDKIESSRSIICRSAVGSRVPAHCTSAGKVLLAYSSEDAINAYCQDLSRYTPYTRNTITDASSLKRTLAEVRSKGYAMDNEEVEDGLICIAAPIFNDHQSVSAAVSISGPSFRMNDNLEVFLPLLKRTCRDISVLIGGDPSAFHTDLI